MGRPVAKGVGMFGRANLEALALVEEYAAMSLLYIRDTFSIEDEPERKRLEDLAVGEFEELSDERIRQILEDALKEGLE